MINRIAKFRFSKEFTEEHFKAAKALLGYKDDSDVLRRLLSLGYKNIMNKQENIKKAKQVLEGYGISPEELKLP